MQNQPRTALLALLFTALAGPAAAQYKIVGPDGRVTYTDRPPTEATGRVSTLGRGGAAAAAATEASLLPFELRQVVARYPVTFFSGENCQPCDAARQLLQQRGVPYTERRVSSDEDQQALERLVGGRMIPAMTVGAQPLRGFNPGDWASFLDAAGYPRESRLPRGWQPPPVAPLVERVAAQRPAAASAPAAAPARPAQPAAEPPPGDAPTIKF